MTQHKAPDSGNKKRKNFQWSPLFPYPSSWLRALILVPIAFPAARLIVFGFGGAILFSATDNTLLFTLSILVGLLIPAILLSLAYFCIKYFLQDTPIKYIYKNFKGFNSLWEGFFGTIVILISFMTLFSIILGLGFLECKFYHEESTEVFGCVGSITGRAARIILDSSDNVGDYFSGRGILIVNSNNFGVKPWFIIWLIIAADCYQIEYLVKHNLARWIKPVFQNPKYRSIVKKLLLICLTSCIAASIYLLLQLAIITKSIPFLTSSPKQVEQRSETIRVEIKPRVIQSPNTYPQPDTFREAVNKATNAANLTQIAKSSKDWTEVASEWQQAIVLMRSVSSESQHYQLSQQKIVEYQKNLNYAQQNAAKY